MGKTAQEQPAWKFRCIVCEQEIRNCGSDGSDKPASLPNIEGGTIDIDFGFGSEFDTCNGWGNRHVVCQTAICDGCMKKKRHLVRWVTPKKTTEWEVLDPDQGCVGLADQVPPVGQ